MTRQITAAVYSIGRTRGIASASNVYNSCKNTSGDSTRCAIQFLPTDQAIQAIQAIQASQTQPVDCSTLNYNSITVPTGTMNYRRLINNTFTINNCQTLTLDTNTGSFNTLVVSGTLINNGTITGRANDIIMVNNGATFINNGTISNITLSGIIYNKGDVSTANTSGATLL